ncbi:MAG: type II toxin-antitoxin system RatA family toxin [Pseudomonadota bacterium]
MPTVSRSALVAYTPDELFALVNDVETYPQFLPFCVEARVLAREGDSTLASMAFARAGIRQGVMTRNTAQVPNRLDIELVEGPFSELRGAWEFRALGNDPAVPASKVTFSVTFAIDSQLVHFAAKPLIDEAAGLALDAFRKRAEQLYGKRS